MIDPNLRKLGIGGSEVGALFDADEFQDAFAVWARKKGGLVEPDGPPDIRMTVGKALEPGVLDLYTYVTGRAVDYCDKTSRHPERPWQVYTPDALCRGERRGVDAKVVFWDQRAKWGHEPDEIPLRVTLQAYWYMSALDYPAWDICALIGWEGLPRVYTIERDIEAERVMLERVEEWVQRYLIGNDRPPMGSSPEAARWLQQAYPEHARPDMRDATPEEVGLLERYVDLRVRQKMLQKQRDEMENAIKDAIANREGLRWSEGSFTWRRLKDTETTEWKTMARRLLDFYVHDREERETLLSIYTHPKLGTRRIHINHPALIEAGDKEEAA